MLSVSLEAEELAHIKVIKPKPYGIPRDTVYGSHLSYAKPDNKKSP